MNKNSNLKSAFTNPRVFLAFIFGSIGVFIALLGFGVFTGASARAQDSDAKATGSKEEHRVGVITGASSKNDVSPPLRTMLPWPVQANEVEHEANPNPPIPNQHIDSPDPVVQNAHVPALAALAPSIPMPIRNFDGIPFPGVGCNCAPPDTNGAVGATQYVQSVNIAYQVFDKNSGASVLGPLSVGAIWTGFGGLCETGGRGDPIVLYDHLANRWLVSQFAGSPPTVECIAISTTSDATGTYNRYSFTLGTNFFDYPHLAVWPDGYYMADNVFNAAGTARLGPQPFAFDRAAMLAGNPATFVSTGITNGPTEPYYLPADLDGTILPAAGSPATFVEFPSGGTYRVFHFHADFATPANSTFTLFASPPAAGFTQLCPSTRACVPELGAANALDGIGDRLMFRLAYRKFSDGHEAVVGNHSVSSGGVAGIRWFELRNVTAGPVTVFQESTYQPDTTWRWMGSTAMDKDGNLAMGFSASSSTINPQIRYAGRFATDPLNTLAQGEATLFAGTGSQTGTGNRWGDYSALTVDPVDDATFWFTTEYYATTTTFNWRTRIGSFKFSTVPTNLILNGGSSIVAAGPNGVLDPGETVTVSLGLVNGGGPGTICTTAALTGTLQPGGGVTSPSGPQPYGALCSNGGAAVFRNFTFTVDPALPCGSTVTASLAAIDGATNYGTITYTFTTGSTVNGVVQNFDGVTAPALPAGWSTTFSGSGTAVATSTTSPDTAPNDIFFSEAATVGLSEVTSAPIAITSAGSKISFRNLYNTESTFDGLVLEVAIPGVAGGAFQDILVAGGTFASGGYNSTLSTGFANPLPGRMAWSGLSGGTVAAPTYITTVVNLPATATGQNIQLRWRQGADASVVPANPGSRIDTVTRTATICGGTAPVPSSAVSRENHTGVGDFDINLPLVQIDGVIGIEPRVKTAGAHQIVVTFASPVTVGGVAVTTGTGAATFSVAGAVVTINLTGATDMQRLGLTMSGVTTGVGNLGNVMIPVGLLSGDVSGNAVVNASDVSQTKALSGTPVTRPTSEVPLQSTFKADVNASGTINTTDIGIVKARSAAGAVLPP